MYYATFIWQITNTRNYIQNRKCIFNTFICYNFCRQCKAGSDVEQMNVSKQFTMWQAKQQLWMICARTLLYMWHLFFNSILCQAAGAFWLYFVDPFDSLSSLQQWLVVLLFFQIFINTSTWKVLVKIIYVTFLCFFIKYCFSTFSH